MGRVACIVPFCGRGSTRLPLEHDEYLCPVHYPLVDRALKSLRRRAKRAGKRRLEFMLWRRMARQAIERAAGI
jgi:hypothetical protein